MSQMAFSIALTAAVSAAPYGFCKVLSGTVGIREPGRMALDECWVSLIPSFLQR